MTNIRILLMTTNDWNGPYRLRHHSIFDSLSQNHKIHVIRLALSLPSTLANQTRSENIVVHEPYVLANSNLLSYYMGNFAFHFSKSLKVIKNEKIDVVVVSNLISGMATISAAKLAGVPAVFDLVDFFPAFVRQIRSVPKLIIGLGEKIASQLLELNLRFSDAVIVTSTVLRDIFERRHPSKIHYVPNGVDTSRFSPSIQPHQSWGAKSMRDIVIGFVGHLDFWIDTEMIIDAVEILAHRISNVKCLMVGGGPGLPNFARELRKRHLEHSFFMPGIVPYEQVPSYIAAMDVCLMPFKKSLVSHGACPNKLFEYLACGKPVVSTRIAEVDRIARGVALFADSGRELADTIVRIGSNEDLKRVLSHKGRLLAMSYDWTTLASAYENILKSVL